MKFVADRPCSTTLPARNAALQGFFRWRQGMLETEGKLPAPGIFEVMPLVTLPVAHDAKMSVAC